MGQNLDVLTTCDCSNDKRKCRSGNQHQLSKEDYSRDDAAACGCGALEDGVQHAVSNIKRGGARISDEVLLNHELLQHARQGNVKGLSTALERGAWTETRRPLVMKPQKPECSNGNGNGGAAGGPDGGAGEEQIGMTALMFAAQTGSAECVRRLLWAGAAVNALEEDGWSALHFAAKEGHLEVCKTLLQSRANPELNNSEDKTPLQVAEEDDKSFANDLRKAALPDRLKM